MKKIKIYGDSILKGVMYNDELKRYKLFGYRYEQLTDNGIEVENNCKMGATIDEGLEIMKATLKDCDKDTVVVLEYGGNDCDFNWAEVSAAPTEVHLPNTPLDTFESLYIDTVRNLKAKGTMPILCNLVPVCSDRYLSWITRSGLCKENILRWLGDENAIYRFQERYSRKIEEIAKKESCPLIDLRGAFLDVRQMETLFCRDGIHPNEQGQALICDTFKNAIENSRLLFSKKPCAS